MPFENGPFEFESSHDDELAGELTDEANWPVRHLALGAQLRDEADILADRYPAGAPPALLLALAQVLEEESADAGAAPPACGEPAAPAKSIGWSLASWTGIVPVALAAAALAAVAGMVVPHWLPTDSGDPVATPGKEPPLTPARIIATSPPADVPAAERAIPVDVTDPMSPALFEELSGPEREGLLDLLEEQPQESRRVSI